MAQLEEISTGSNISGVAGHEPVMVVAVKWYGNAVLEITFKDARGRLDSQLLYREDEARIEVIDGSLRPAPVYRNIYYLNHAGKDKEINMKAKLVEKDKNLISLDVNIRSPHGIIIMGRDNGLSPDQLTDFEVVKRKYKNIVDIITYNELIRRLEMLIKRFKPDNEEKIVHDQKANRSNSSAGSNQCRIGPREIHPPRPPVHAASLVGSPSTGGSPCGDMVVACRRPVEPPRTVPD
jgi:hypothetical protein